MANETSGIEPTAGDTRILSLVLQDQGPTQPKHWLLYVALANEKESGGRCFQVTGNPLCMVYWAPDKLINIKKFKSYFDTVELTGVTKKEAAMVQEIASQERPPRARDWPSRTENCQGWTVRVLNKLNERGVVPQSKIRSVESMMESI